MDQNMRNDLVRDAIEKLRASCNNAARADLYSHLTKGFFLLAVADVPHGVEVEGTILPQDTPVTVLTASVPDGGTAILAFTDLESLRARISKASHIVMLSRDVLEMVIEQNYDALILNPAGPWAGVPREDILRILAGVSSDVTI
jgi:hypothetical protein